MSVVPVVRMRLTGLTRPLLSELGLLLAECGYPLWTQPPFPDGTALLMVELPHERVAWLRNKAARYGCHARISRTGIHKVLNVYSLRGITPPQPAPIFRPFTLRVKPTTKDIERFRVVDRAWLPIARSLVAAGISPRIVLSGTQTPLLYLETSSNVRRALIRQGIACTRVTSMPSRAMAPSFDRLSVWRLKEQCWYVHILPKDYDHPATPPLGYTLREESHQALVSNHIGSDLKIDGHLLWRFNWENRTQESSEHPQGAEEGRPARQSRSRACAG